MCGIVGVVSQSHVNQLIYDALLLLQHRGQDAAGIVTQLDRKFFMQKAKGMVRDVFRTRNMRALPGNIGLGQVRYPTAGNAYSEEEAQPFYVNAPFGLVMVHNGNLTNAQVLKAELFSTDHRHINTESDSEVLLNVLAHEVERTTRGMPLKPEHLFEERDIEEYLGRGRPWLERVDERHLPGADDGHVLAREGLAEMIGEDIDLVACLAQGLGAVGDGERRAARLEEDVRREHKDA